jgi:uncharacterized protein YbaA (DUF1428 family)
MKYVDGFVLTVKKDKLEEYREMANKAGEFWKKHGALGYFEFVGDDLNPDTQGAEIMNFPKLTEMKEDETVIFAFIMYESREHRDEVNKKVMEDPQMKGDCEDKEMPFDMKKMSWGGFKSIVEKTKEE